MQVEESILLNTQITTPAISTLIAATVAYIISKRNNRRADKASLDNRYNEIIQIAIQYPYLENGIFADSWSTQKTSAEDKYVRYDNYCKLVFNFIENYCQYYNYRQKKIEKTFNLRDWVIVHKQWVQEPYVKIEKTKKINKKLKKILDKYASIDYERYPNALF